MPIAIHLRTIAGLCLYRDTIISVLNYGGGDSALLCSGFFQENFKGSTYQASAEWGLIEALTTNSIFLDTFGIHNNQWNPSYKNFCNNLANAGVMITPWRQQKFRWHAKIFILKRRGVPIFGIVGSSNVTANAFGTRNNPSLPDDSPNPPANFNYEGDVFLWEATNRRVDEAARAFLYSGENLRQTYRTIYRSRDNAGLTITDRLKILESQILDAGNFELLQL